VAVLLTTPCSVPFGAGEQTGNENLPILVCHSAAGLSAW
jgi:hypothetical protein